MTVAEVTKLREMIRPGRRRKEKKTRKRTSSVQGEKRKGVHHIRGGCAFLQTEAEGRLEREEDRK